MPTWYLPKSPRVLQRAAPFVGAEIIGGGPTGKPAAMCDLARRKRRRRRGILSLWDEAELTGIASDCRQMSKVVSRNW